MNIVFATDNNFVQHCCVALTSVLYHNKGACIYIITDGLTRQNEEILRNQTERLGGTFRIAKVDNEIKKQLPMPKIAAQHISIATYYRLFVEELLPETVEKCIYLDCDMIVRGSLRKLWNVNVENKPIAACYQHNTWATNTYKGRKNRYELLGMQNPIGYFNAGMLVINLKYWREKRMKDNLLNYMHIYYDKIINHDQDILNGYLYKDVVSLSNIWNFRLPLVLDYYGDFYVNKKIKKEIQDNAIIIHYVNRPKPWEYSCNHPYVREYYKYLNMTVYKGWSPQFSVQNIYKYHIRTFGVDIKHLIDRIFKTGYYNKKNYAE